MGDINQYNWLKKNLDHFEGTVLEIGSKFYGDDVSYDYRSLFSEKGYVGTDMQDGKNVDIVCDFTNDFDQIDKTLGNKRFGTIINFSVLEHCKDPIQMGKNIERLLKPGGRVCVSVPFIWDIHAYPNDYWRFTPQAIEMIFPNMTFEKEEWNCYSTKIPGEVFPIADLKEHHLRYRKKFHSSKYRKNGQYLKALEAGFASLLAKTGLFKWVFQYKYMYPHIMINMVGTKKS